jgi:hypothetical protein
MQGLVDAALVVVTMIVPALHPQGVQKFFHYSSWMGVLVDGRRLAKVSADCYQDVTKRRQIGNAGR